MGIGDVGRADKGKWVKGQVGKVLGCFGPFEYLRGVFSFSKPNEFVIDR